MRHKQSCDRHVRCHTGCAECLVRKRLYNKQWKAAELRQRRLSAPAKIVRDRLRELRALGYGIDSLSKTTGLDRSTIFRLSSETNTSRVQVKTYRAVEKAWLELREFPATKTDRRSARVAARRGWSPPTSLTGPDDGPVIDWVAIDRAIQGDRAALAALSYEEKECAVEAALDRGWLLHQVSDRLGVNIERVRRVQRGEKRGPGGTGKKKQAA